MQNRFTFCLVAAVLSMSLIAKTTSFAANEEVASTRAPEIAFKSTQSEAAPAWLEGNGALTTSQVIELLGAAPTPEQRAQIEEAVNARNVAIRQANLQLSLQLQGILKTDDAALSKRAAAQKEARELEIIRRRQPARYQSMKRKMEAQKNK